MVNIICDITVKGVNYKIKDYKGYRDEYDLYVDGKIVLDSKPKMHCIAKILELVED